MNLDEVLAETIALGAHWSVSIRRGKDAAAFVDYRPRTLLRTASVAKVFVLMELADRLRCDTLDADRLVDRRLTHRVLDSGLWHALRIDALPVIDVAVLVGAHSDNWATNALIDVCGLDRIQARASATAPVGSTLHDYVRDERGPGLPAILSEGCAEDWVSIMQRLYLADGIHVEVCHLVLGWLAQDADLSMVAAAFDLDPLAHDTDDLGLRLWHKTGTDLGVRADVGVICSGAAAMSYAVICNWPATDTRRSTRRAVLSAMRRIGDEIDSRLWRDAGGDRYR